MIIKCLNNECSNNLSEIQIKRGCKFCSPSCSSSYNTRKRARIPATLESKLKTSNSMKKIWSEPAFREKMKDHLEKLSELGSRAAQKAGNYHGWAKRGEKGFEKLHHFAKGNKPWNTGLTKENDSRLVEIGVKNSKHLLGSIQAIESIAKRVKTRIKNGKAVGKDHWMRKRPLPIDFTKKSLRRHEKSSLEIGLENIIIKNNLPYKFVGNGEVIVSNKCPDFVHTDKKIALEVFCTKHKEKFRHGGCEEWMKNRQEIFEKEGWKIFFFNERQVKENIILERLENI
jgi:very-short-patch-repair endonuclease